VATRTIRVKPLGRILLYLQLEVLDEPLCSDAQGHPHPALLDGGATSAVASLGFGPSRRLHRTVDPRWDTLIAAVAMLVTALSLAAGIASYLPIRRKTG